MDLHAQGGCKAGRSARAPGPPPRSPRAAPTYVLLLELAGQVAFHERRLPGAAVAHQHELRRHAREPRPAPPRPPGPGAAGLGRPVRTLNCTCGSPCAAIAAILRTAARGLTKAAGAAAGPGPPEARPATPTPRRASPPAAAAPRPARPVARRPAPGSAATFQKRLRARPTEAGKMAEARFKCRRRSRRRAEGGASRGGATAPRPITRLARAHARTHVRNTRLKRSPLPASAQAAVGHVEGLRQARTRARCRARRLGGRALGTHAPTAGGAPCFRWSRGRRPGCAGKAGGRVLLIAGCSRALSGPSRRAVSPDARGPLAGGPG